MLRAALRKVDKCTQLKIPMVHYSGFQELYAASHTCHGAVMPLSLEPLQFALNLRLIPMSSLGCPCLPEAGGSYFRGWKILYFTPRDLRYVLMKSHLWQVEGGLSQRCLRPKVPSYSLDMIPFTP